MQEKWSWIEGTHGMRSQLLDILSDADLAFSPGGQTITLGTLLRERKATVCALSDEDLMKTVDRGGFTMPVELQLDVYLQALLIFPGKATIYLKAMNKPLPEQIQDSIG